MSSSSNNGGDFSDVRDTIFQHLEEDKERYKKLKRLTKSFQEADNEKTQTIQALQDKPFLSDFEQEYVNFLRIQCMKDFQNLRECQQLSTQVAQQIEEKQQFFEKFNNSTLWTVSHSGNIRYIDWVQIAKFSISQMNEMMLELGYNSVEHLCYQFRVPGMAMDGGLRQLSNDEDVALLLHHVMNLSTKVIEIYVLS